ncbi:hypothetical protein OG559_19665 [Micromonospora sp. NBC_01405]
MGAQVGLRALDLSGRVVGSGRFAEVGEGERIFNEQVASNW